MINVIVNGEKVIVPDNINLSELLKHLELPSERIAVELNREVVRRLNWEKIAVAENDKLEIVHFVGGG